MRSDTFSIQKITRSDDQTFVVIVFSSNYEMTNGSEEIVEGGTFTLDMSLLAAVTEYSIHTKAATGQHWWYEGKTNYVSDNGIPYPESSSDKSGFSGAEPHIIALAKYANVRAADLDGADCRLSAFGFAEPGFSSQPSAAYWRTLLVLGNIAVGIIAFIIWRKSRQMAN